MNTATFLAEETLQKSRAEAEKLRGQFRQISESENGKAVLRNLFQVFGGPAGGDGFEFARQCGRQEVLNYILKHGGTLNGNGNG